jgi:DNA ligase (NAD+)
LIENGFDTIDKLFGLARENDPATLIALHSIDEKTVARISEAFSQKRIASLVEALRIEALTALRGIGEKTAARIIDEFSREDTALLVAALRAEGLNFSAAPKEISGEAQIFAGQTWCVTGSFENFQPRDLAMEEVKKRGGKVVSAVSGNLTHLLAGEAAGSKLDKAKKAGARIVGEAEFLDMLGKTVLTDREEREK